MPPVCPFCGASPVRQTCVECTQASEGIEWTVEPRRWSPLRTLIEAWLIGACAVLHGLPAAHAFAAILIAVGGWKTVDGLIARVFVSAIVLVMAAVEVSLLRGLMQRVLRRWARRWRFHAPNGSGWVEIAAGRALSGWGSIAKGGAKYRWIADYLRGSRNATRVEIV